MNIVTEIKQDNADLEHAGKTSQKKRDQNAYKRARKSRRKRARLTAGVARDRTLSIKSGKYPPFSNKDFGGAISYSDEYNDDILTDFISYLGDTSIEYSRLHIKTKILLNQYMMLRLQRQSSELISVPVTIWLNKHQQTLSDTTLKHYLRSVFRQTLERIPLFWTATHRNKRKSINAEQKHLHGEFLITRSEIEPLMKALEGFYGEGAADNEAIAHHLPTRDLIRQQYGELYSHLNWSGYATGELTFQQFSKRLLGKYKHDHFHYVSADLNSITRRFYNEHIFRQFVTANSGKFIKQALQDAQDSTKTT